MKKYLLTAILFIFLIPSIVLARQGWPVPVGTAFSAVADSTISSDPYLWGGVEGTVPGTQDRNSNLQIY